LCGYNESTVTKALEVVAAGVVADQISPELFWTISKGSVEE
jgi:hypothetical protein